MKNQFLLDPNITYLNHGSFGACPKPLFKAYQKYQEELEFNAVQFIINKLPVYFEEARKALGDFVGCDKDDLVFFPNPTHAINLVVKNFDFSEGDEILGTELEYGACDRTWQHYAALKGAKYIRQHINLPIQSKAQILEDFWKGYTDKTKAIFISHMTSATALLLPVKEIIKEAKNRNLITIIDGAHIPGHFKLDIDALDPDYYIGACHKWMNGPKGSSFIYTRKELQNDLNPLVVSWGYEAEFPSHSQYLDYHQMQGTRDSSAFCVIPEVIAYFKEHNWWEKVDAAKQLILDNYQDLCDIVGTKPVCPVSPVFLGQMCSIPIPKDYKDPMKLKDRLYDEFKIEIPVSVSNEDYFIRLSTQVYVLQKDIDQLKGALKSIFKKVN